MPTFLSLLSKLIAAILVSAITGAIFAVVFNNTVLNSHYLEGQLQTTNSYDALSVALTNDLSKQMGASGNPQVTAELQKILTPAVLKQNINTALNEFQEYAQGKGPAPVINLSSLASQLQTAGIPLTQNNELSQPITLGSSNPSTTSTSQGLSRTFDHVRLGSIILSILLTIVLLVVSWERHRWAALPDVVISVGVIVCLLALIFALTPDLASHFIHFNSGSNAFAVIGDKVATSISNDLAKRFAIIGGVCLAAGIIGRILVGRFRKKPNALKSTLNGAPKAAPAR